VADQETRRVARLAAAVALPVALVAGLGAFWALDGFGNGPAHRNAAPSPAPQATAPVSLAAPTLGVRPATICRALLAQLPTALRDRVRRPVTAGPEQNAAYGDPAITLACGSGPAPSVDPTADVYPLSGVCWYAVPGPDTTTWSTLDRAVSITVTVPNSYSGQGQWVIELSGPIVAAVPSVTTVPSGCVR
jgi:hypothetical protein